jgi:hypothetical protein
MHKECVSTVNMYHNPCFWPYTMLPLCFLCVLYALPNLCLQCASWELHSTFATLVSAAVLTWPVLQELSSILANTSSDPSPTAPLPSSSNDDSRRLLSAAGGTNTRRSRSLAGAYQSRGAHSTGGGVPFSRRPLQGPGVTLPGLGNTTGSNPTNSSTNSTSSSSNGTATPLQGSQISEASRGPTEQIAALNAFLATIPGVDNAPVPVITPQQAEANATLATAAPLQTLNIMLCSASRFMNDSADLLPLTATPAAAGASPGSVVAGGVPTRPTANATAVQSYSRRWMGATHPQEGCSFSIRTWCSDRWCCRW